MSEGIRIDEALAVHGEFVRRLAQSLLRDEHAAADLAQDAWVAALEARESSVGNVRAWLARVVRNLASMRLRSERARRGRETAVAARCAALPDPAELLGRLDEAEQLTRAVRGLHEPFRSTVILRYREGLAPRRIAARTGVPLETVKSRLKRGLAMLRADLIGAHDGDERAWRKALLPLALWRPPRAAALAVPGLVVVVATTAWLLAELSAEVATREGPVAVPAITADPRGTRGDSAADRVATAGVEREARGATRRLRLLDAATGEALPGFVLGVEGGFAMSDAAGDLQLPAATSRVLVLDDPRMARRQHVRIPGAVSGELRIPVGPTYRLLLATPVAPSDELQARLSGGDERVAFGSSFAPVRVAKGDAWVRFGPEASLLRGGPPWRLEVRSDDGYLLGRAAVPVVSGRQSEPVVMRLEQCGRVTGRVNTAAGEPVSQVRVRLESTGRSFETASDEGGRFDLPWLPPGGYTVRASSRLHAEATAAVTVYARSDTPVRLTLGKGPRRGVLAGRLTSERGAEIEGPVTIVLTSRSRAPRVLTQKVAGLGAFRFEGVPAGAYEVTVHAPDFARWRVTPRRVVVPETEVVLTRRDSERCRDLRVGAVDPSGAPVGAFDLFVRLDGDERSSRVIPARAGSVELRKVPDDARIEWVLRARGFVPARGRRASLSAEVPLERGWGNTFRVVDATDTPVPGLELLFDGHPAGKTDRRGRLAVRRARAPRTVAVRHDSLRLRGGDVFPADGRFQDLIWGITLVVGPR